MDISVSMKLLMSLRIMADYETNESLTIRDAEKSLELCGSVLEDIAKLP